MSSGDEGKQGRLRERGVKAARQVEKAEGELLVPPSSRCSLEEPLHLPDSQVEDLISPLQWKSPPVDGLKSRCPPSLQGSCLWKCVVHLARRRGKEYIQPGLADTTSTRYEEVRL